jgi:hypothetical protein
MKKTLSILILILAYNNIYCQNEIKPVDSNQIFRNFISLGVLDHSAVSVGYTRKLISGKRYSLRTGIGISSAIVKLNGYYFNIDSEFKTKKKYDLLLGLKIFPFYSSKKIANQTIYFIRDFIAGCYFGFIGGKPHLKHEFRFIINIYYDQERGVGDSIYRNKNPLRYVFPFISYNINFGLGKK